MEHNASVFFLSLLLLPSLAFFVFVVRSRGRGRVGSRLPPGPPPLPLLGSFHLLASASLHRSFHRLSKIYGPIMHLRLGSVPAVVVSSAAIAMDILKTHDQKFASRPETAMGKLVSYGYEDTVFSPYNPHWRYMRKVLTLELLTAKRLQQQRHAREQEVRAMLRRIQEAAGEAAEVDLATQMSATGVAVLSRMILRERFRESMREEVGEFLGLLHAMVELLAAFVAADYFPWLRWFDPYGSKRRMRIVHGKIDAVLEKIVRRHEEDDGVQPHVDGPDFVDTLLHIQRDGTEEESKFLSRNSIKAVVLNMFVGGSDTASHVVVWAVSELLRNTELLQQAQAEIDSVVGHTRMVEESDIPHLTFLKAVVKETLRLYPNLPLLLPHEALEDCKVAGYDIPRATRVFVNAWAIARDSSVWKKPLDFYPQRFLEESSDIEANGQNFNLLPFGSGRRGCPGMVLGSTMVHFSLACLLHCFDISLPKGQDPKELDMHEAPGIVITREKPLMVTCKPRLSTQSYMKM